ncbi:hypothetical protein OTSUT76_2937 [Orientia tsutsugamushi str. UT76]|nr:hypothetical protein OTSUT76_2937 [Orientia tsutsugamushi str. UT76]
MSKYVSLDKFIVVPTPSKYVSLDKFIVVPTPKSIPVPLSLLKADTRPPVTKLMLCYLQLYCNNNFLEQSYLYSCDDT